MSRYPRVPDRTTTGFAFSILDRAIREGLASRRFGRIEIEEVHRFFGWGDPECVYCGAPEVTRWDHAIPVNRGGETMLGNMVPACGRCDDSKRGQPFEEWMESSAKHSPKSRGVMDIAARKERIRRYMEHFGYTSRSLQDHLTPEEIGTLEAIRSRAKSLREGIESLIRDHQMRVSAGRQPV